MAGQHPQLDGYGGSADVAVALRQRRHRQRVVDVGSLRGHHDRAEFGVALQGIKPLTPFDATGTLPSVAVHGHACMSKQGGQASTVVQDRSSPSVALRVATRVPMLDPPMAVSTPSSADTCLRLTRRAALRWLNAQGSRLSQAAGGRTSSASIAVRNREASRFLAASAAMSPQTIATV
jgi:hypothetical protein